MRAITITGETETIQLVAVPEPTIHEGECLVRIKTAALNRRDQWIREGMYPGIRLGCILGSDGCGIVEDGAKEWLGKEVVINPNVNWGDNPDVQSADYSVLGMPTNGTLSEYITVPTHRLHIKPEHLNYEQAAALPLAGLTAFRATIKKGLAGNGKNVLITGAGGGVSQMAIAFSVASGARTFVTSGSDSKIEECLQFGVEDGFNYKKEDWFKDASKVGGFDTIIDSAGGSQLNNYIKIVKPSGRIIMYGSTIGYPEKLDVFRLFWSQAQIMGSTMGSDTEFEEMLKFIVEQSITPTIDRVFKMDDYLTAFNRFKDPNHLGKIVLSITN